MLIIENFDIAFTTDPDGKEAIIVVLEQQDIPPIGKPVQMRSVHELGLYYFELLFENHSNQRTACRLEIASFLYDEIRMEHIWVCATEEGRIVFEQKIPFLRENNL